MKYLINFALILLILVVVGNTIKRIQDNKRAQEEAAKQAASDPNKPDQFTDEQWELIKQANTVPKDYTPVPTMTGSASRIVTGDAVYKYLAYIPHGYDDQENQERRYPLIVFLHGQNGKGSDPRKLYSQSPIQELQSREDPNFIMVAPLCPEGGGWVSLGLNKCLDQIIGRFRVDTDRLYLTGISMGGHGTWSWAQEFPNRFAAIAPVCGSGSPAKAKLRLRHLPIWIFHGAQDDVVPVERAYSMIRALESVHGNVRSNIFPDQGHNIFGIYQRPELYVWFLTHSKDPKKSLLYQAPEGTVSSATDVVDTATIP